MKAHLVLGNLSGILLKIRRVKRADHGELEFVKAALVEKVIMHREAAGGGVHADRQIQSAGFLIDRKKMWSR